MRYATNILLAFLLVGFACTSAQAQKKKNRHAKAPAKHVTAAPKQEEGAADNNTSSSVSRQNLSDTAVTHVVTITSAFKPSLKTAAKINFSAAVPVIDSSRPAVLYSIPAQNLVFSYQPVPIKPLALAVDSGYTWNNDHYLKAGIGNFSTLFGEGAFSFGDGKKSITNLHANYISGKGDLFAQQYAKFGLDVVSIFNTNHNNEWTARGYYENTTSYFYGFQPSAVAYAKDDLLRHFNKAGIEAGVQNKMENAFNITYHPQVRLNYFADNKQNNEYNLLIKAPINKSFGKMYAFDLGVTADITSVSTSLYPGTSKLTNNLYAVSPSLQFKTPDLKLNIGIQPAWDNQSFSTLPNITAEAKIKETNLVVEAGWIGYYHKNTYQSLAGFNPWVVLPNTLLNTKTGEQYAGIKGSAGHHFIYNARLSFLQFANQPLYVNAAPDGRMFNVVYEPDMKVLQLHGELGYTLQEKFSVLAAATYRQFASLSKYDKAFGLLPLELSGTLKWRIVKDLQVKADAFVWDGNYYQDLATAKTLKLDPAADLNIGAEFSVLPRLNLWIQLNNVLNNKYQRWNQYQTLGLNVMGGVVYSFR